MHMASVHCEENFLGFAVTRGVHHIAIKNGGLCVRKPVVGLCVLEVSVQ
ncbi:hypothetical protein [Planctomicrobium sp. SH527]